MSYPQVAQSGPQKCGRDLLRTYCGRAVPGVVFSSAGMDTTRVAYSCVRVCVADHANCLEQPPPGALETHRPTVETGMLLSSY